jgi:protoporphyrinogen oxidase
MTAIREPRLSELDFQRQLVGPHGLATMLGWKHVHVRKGRTKDSWATSTSGELGKGWPDLVLVRERDRRLIFAELKADDGKLTLDQELVLEALRALQTIGPIAPEPVVIPRIEVVVWRPRDFDAIAETLR